MKTQKQSDGCWKTDPRAAYIPGAVLVSLILLLCLTVGPAWSFETFDGVQDQTVFDDSKQALTTSYPSQPSSPTMVDSCLPLLKSIHHTSPVPAMDRNQRSAGKAAAAGLIQGVRFALSPPQKPSHMLIDRVLMSGKYLAFSLVTVLLSRLPLIVNARKNRR